VGVAVLDIDVWAREVAQAEAVLVRRAVAEAIAAGRGPGAALEAVRRRMERLTPAQREIVVEAIAADAKPASR
jgi:hypothetical protein